MPPPSAHGRAFLSTRRAAAGRGCVPVFQGSLAPVEGSQSFVSTNRRDIFLPSVAAIANAFKEANREMPPELVARESTRRVAR